eukprot:SAG31_NODE_495_length_14864_cov_21.943109_9_plen_758_part_00
MQVLGPAKPVPGPVSIPSQKKLGNANGSANVNLVQPGGSWNAASRGPPPAQQPYHQFHADPRVHQHQQQQQQPGPFAQGGLDGPNHAGLWSSGAAVPNGHAPLPLHNGGGPAVGCGAPPAGYAAPVYGMGRGESLPPPAPAFFGSDGPVGPGPNGGGMGRGGSISGGGWGHVAMGGPAASGPYPGEPAGRPWADGQSQAPGPTHGGGASWAGTPADAPIGGTYGYSGGISRYGTHPQNQGRALGRLSPGQGPARGGDVPPVQLEPQSSIAAAARSTPRQILRREAAPDSGSTASLDYVPHGARGSNAESGSPSYDYVPPAARGSADIAREGGAVPSGYVPPAERYRASVEHSVVTSISSQSDRLQTGESTDVDRSSSTVSSPQQEKQKKPQQITIQKRQPQQSERATSSNGADKRIVQREESSSQKRRDYPGNSKNSSKIDSSRNVPAKEGSVSTRTGTTAAVSKAGEPEKPTKAVVKDMGAKMLMVMQTYPGGVSEVSMQESIKKTHGSELNFERYGFKSLVAFAKAFMSDKVAFVDVKKKGNPLLMKIPAQYADKHGIEIGENAVVAAAVDSSEKKKKRNTKKQGKGSNEAQAKKSSPPSKGLNDIQSGNKKDSDRPAPRQVCNGDGDGNSVAPRSHAGDDSVASDDAASDDDESDPISSGGTRGSRRRSRRGRRKKAASDSSDNNNDPAAANAGSVASETSAALGPAGGGKNGGSGGRGGRGGKGRMGKSGGSSRGGGGRGGSGRGGRGGGGGS